jgi:hypothetical protein
MFIFLGFRIFMLCLLVYNVFVCVCVCVCVTCTRIFGLENLRNQVFVYNNLK